MSPQSIYLDNNAGTHLHPQVLDAMLPFLREQFHNPSAPYRNGAAARAALEQARSRCAEALGALPEEIYFCSGGTEAINWALWGAARYAPKDRRTAVISAVEHPAVRNTALALAADGFRVRILPVDTDGVVHLDAADDALGPETAVVSVMHAGNETGVLQPIDAIAAMAAKRGILFHVGAVQSAGKLPLHLSESGAHLVTISGHKLHGPKGSGILYIRQGTEIAPLVTGGGQERGGRSGTENVPAAVGLAEALEIARLEAEEAMPRIAALRDRLEREVCAALRDVTVNGAGAPRLPGTSSLAISGVDSESKSEAKRS